MALWAEYQVRLRDQYWPQHFKSQELLNKKELRKKEDRLIRKF